MPAVPTTNASEPLHAPPHPQQNAIQQVTPTQVTPQTHQEPQQVQSHIQQMQQVSDFRIDGTLLDKRTTHLLLQPRFLSPNSMLGARFPFIPNFPQHQTTAHEEMLDTVDQGDAKKSFACYVCQKEFSSRQYLKKHEVMHHSAVTLTCTTCGKNFDKKTALNRHMLSHTSVRAHVCQECGKGEDC